MKSSTLGKIETNPDNRTYMRQFERWNQQKAFREWSIVLRMQKKWLGRTAKCLGRVFCASDTHESPSDAHKSASDEPESPSDALVSASNTHKSTSNALESASDGYFG